MSKLAIIFPGIGYTPDKPLLYYGRKLAEKAGYECRTVSYDYHGDKRKLRGDPEKMQEVFTELYAQTVQALSGVEFTDHEEVLFLSKSVGTVIAAAYAKKLQKEGNECKAVIRQIFYTPLEATFTVTSAEASADAYAPGQAIGFLGTADPWSNPKEVLRLAGQKQVPMYVYEDANHSLETGVVGRDLDNLKDVMENTAEFLSRN